jgi:hypothetical protein
VYVSQFFLEVSSPYGTASGSSWYDAGSVATFSVASTEQPMQGLLGLLGGRYLFDHWSSGSTGPTAKIRLDSPQKVTAVWREELTSVYLVGVITLGVVATVVILLLRSRRETVPFMGRSISPRPRHGSICPSCRTRNRLGSGFCRRCGTSLQTAGPIVCPSCRSTNKQTNMFCRRCGVRIR